VQIASSFALSRILQTAVLLKIFPTIAEGVQNSKTLAEKLACDPRGLGLLLNALVALDLLEKKYNEERSDWSYTLTPVAKDHLLPSAPQYYGWMIELDAKRWSDWSGLETAVRSGKPVTAKQDLWSDPEYATSFAMAMHSAAISRGAVEAVVQKIDLGSCRKLLDLGCGPASFTIGFLKQYPMLQAVGMDLPEALKAAAKLTHASGVENRLHLKNGNYLEENIGEAEYDAVFISNVIHIENAAVNQGLFMKIAKALRPGGQVIIKDYIMDVSLTKPADGAIFAVRMLLSNYGRCYSFVEVNDWLSKAGFKNSQVIPPEPPMTSSLLIAYKDR
jgi:SAM-dependent methyltransferase